PPPPETTTITPALLTHLHNLSALPPPTTPSATATILATLHAQLHFVQSIRTVDTAGVPPLHSIRDETAAGLAEATISTATLRDALAAEETYGKHRRPRRRQGQGQPRKGGAGDAAKGIEGVEDWDVLGNAGQKAGRYFVVRSGKGE
ncbi:hypothetical protein BT67DRAFT_389656, partial [Trichocladium antarcticum]